MSEDISRLMDGELDDDAAEHVCAAMRDAGAQATWACYHVIGDQLRGTAVRTVGARSSARREASSVG